MSDSRQRFNDWLRTAREPMDTWAMWQAAEAAAAQRCAEIADTLACHYRDVYKNRKPSDGQAYHPHTDGLSDGAAQVEDAIRAEFSEAFK